MKLKELDTIQENIKNKLNKEGQELLQKLSPAPIFKPVEATLSLSSEELIADMREILQERVQKIKVDTTSYLLEFAKYFNEQKEINENRHILDIFSTFPFDPYAYLQKVHGAGCLGISMDLLNHIPKKYKPHLIASLYTDIFQPAYLSSRMYICYSHAAVLIPFRNPEKENRLEYLLLDPSYNLALPIHLKKSQEEGLAVDMHEMGTGLFYLEEEVIIGKANWPNRGYNRIFRTDELINYNESIGKQLFLTLKEFTIKTRDQNGSCIAMLSIDFKERNLKPRVKDTKLAIIAFEDQAKKDTISKELAFQLGYEEDELNARLRNLIQYEPLLRQLNDEFQNLIKNIANEYTSPGRDNGICRFKNTI